MENIRHHYELVLSQEIICNQSSYKQNQHIHSTSIYVRFKTYILWRSATSTILFFFHDGSILYRKFNKDAIMEVLPFCFHFIFWHQKGEKGGLLIDCEYVLVALESIQWDSGQRSHASGAKVLSFLLVKFT